MGKFDRYAFSAQPAFDEAETRKAFSQAVPLKTLVIYCYDPRAAEIPDAVAKLFGDEVFPGRDHRRRIRQADSIIDDDLSGHRRRRSRHRRSAIHYRRPAPVRD